MTLNVNSTGAKNLYQYGTTLMNSGTTTTGWPAGAIVPFVYDGTYWFRLYWTNTGTVTSITPGNGLLNGTGTSAITTTGTLNLNYGTSASAIGTTSAAGSANTVSRSDHVHSIALATGDNNGQVKIAGQNIDVKGLGSNAYTSTAYAPLASPALTGTPTAPTPAATSNDTTIATTAFVMNAFTANDAMVFKGVVNANGDLPATHKQGWTYRVATAGTYAGKVCEVGDMIVCVTDGTAANNDHWAVIQNNVDGAVYRGTNAFTDANIIVADSTNGKVKSSEKTITTTAPSSSAADTTIPTSKAVWSAISGASGYGKTGTVTSVRVQATAPIVSSSNATATTSLNTTISLAATSANYVIAGPTSGTATAVPTYRKLVAADIPSLTKSKISDFPTDVSAFTNDSGYLTSFTETDPTVPSWAKAASKPSYTASEVGAAAASHTHGNLSNDGKITTTATIASGDKLVIVDSDSTAGSKITGSSITFGTSTTTFLSNKGTWITPPGTYSLPLAASGTRGGIKIGYSESENNYAVKLSSEKAYVTVPFASTTQSGVVSTAAQKFAGVKSFAHTSNIYTTSDTTSPRLYFKQADDINIGSIGVTTSKTNNIQRPHAVEFQQYSYNSSTGEISTTGWEMYRLPEVTAGMTTTHVYSILTTKSPVTIDQGGTGATIASDAVKNLIGTTAIGSSVKPIYWSGSAFSPISYKIALSSTGTDDIGFTAENTSKTHKVSFIIGGSSGSGGVYDNTYSKWLVYSDTAGNVQLNGNAFTATKATKDSDGNAINTTYVKKSGDTMTGALVFSSNANNTYPYIKRTDVDSSVTSLSSAKYAMLTGVKDNNNNWMGYIENMISTTGENQLQVAARKSINGSNVNNALALKVAANGTKSAIFESDVLPKTNNALNLGNSSYKWKDISATYLSGAFKQTLNLYAKDASDTAKSFVEIYARNHLGNIGGQVLYSVSSTATIAGGQWQFREYSPNNPASATSTGKYEQYSLPNVTSGLSATQYYEILTTKLHFTNKTVATSGWTGNDTTYSGFPYKANITCTGVTANHVPNVIFDYNELISGNFCPFADSSSNTITIYCKERPSATITIPTIYCT